jgi:hypothetical protein
VSGGDAGGTGDDARGPGDDAAERSRETGNALRTSSSKEESTDLQTGVEEWSGGVDKSMISDEADAERDGGAPAKTSAVRSRLASGPSEGTGGSSGAVGTGG